MGSLHKVLSGLATLACLGLLLRHSFSADDVSIAVPFLRRVDRRNLLTVADPRDPRSVAPRTGVPLLPNQAATLHQIDRSSHAPLEPNGHPMGQFVPEAERSNYLDAYQDDGCGRISINNRRSSTWTNLRQSEINEAMDLQACLKRTGWEVYATRIDNAGLSCRTPVSFDTIRTTLSRYDTVWLFGDSIMAQVFYTLACAVNFTVSVPTRADIGNPGTWEVGLGERSALIEKFTYSHEHGRTEIKYSRFGPRWTKLGNENLYRNDFPFAVRTLSSKDAILTTGAAVHYSVNAGSQFAEAVNFIAKQSLLSNAPVFLFEPTPEEWPTSNGLYTQSCGRCRCERLTDDRLQGRGNFTQRSDRLFFRDKEYAETVGKPEKDFFRRLYPNMNEVWMNVNTDRCIPNCLPNSWRTDLVRVLLKEVPNDVHLVPVYYQMLSKDDEAARGHGDCTHRNLYGTQLMLFQWVRTILWGSHTT